VRLSIAETGLCELRRQRTFSARDFSDRVIAVRTHAEKNSRANEFR